MARRSQNIRASSFLGLTLLLGACFDPDPSPIETEGVDTTTAGDTAMVCEPGQVQDCTCEGDEVGVQTCDADGSGFGACECGGADSTTTIGPPDTSTTEPPPECEVDDDCAELAEGECQAGVCNADGMCEVQALAEGTPCGDATETECSGADGCDARGQCSANDALDGTACADCPLGACACTAGACGDCLQFAPENNFITARSISGWTLTGGWGLYRQAPQSFDSGPAVFDGQVFGTDGNRSVPYPGNDNESSSARSAPMMLPASLDFLSWNVDEGSFADTKQINVSTDGGATFTTLVDCSAGGGQPFCNFRGAERSPDDWDAISIPVPPAMVGQLGLVELVYVTGDACCGFEKGWYIDVTNFATECACVDDAACEGLGGECGAGVCGGMGECELDAVAAGMACGDAADGGTCDDPDACDGIGYCEPNAAINGLTTCEDCPAGAGLCNACQEGACVDCQTLVTTNFDFGLPGGWLIEDLGGTGADWQVVTNAPQNQDPGSVPLPLSLAPSFGTDGNRQAPYPGSESESSRVTTASGEVPATLTFSSWNVDEGGSGAYDGKIVELSVDGGASWIELVNCGTGLNTQPFCDVRDDTRLGDDWDAIALDTAAYAGQQGQLRFTYNTGDSCCTFERGWYIDNLNLGGFCADSPF